MEGVTTNDTNSSQSSKKQITATKKEIRNIGNNQFSYVPIPAEKFIIVIGNEIQ
jgi:hypothetical protein